MKLYHATALENISTIRSLGLNAQSYFSSNKDLATYYLETIKDEGQEPVLLVIDSEDLDPRFFTPDRPGIDEPISIVLGIKEEEVQKEWNASSKTWMDSIRIVGSLRYDTRVAASLINVDSKYSTIPIIDYDNMLIHNKKQRLQA